VLKESVQEVTCQESKSPLEEGGEHHSFVGIGCREVYPYGRPPLEHNTIWEKVILNKFENLAFIRSWLLGHVRMGSGHGGGRGTHNEGLRLMLEEKERMGQKAQEDEEEMAVAEKVT
jgi:hypothetical protein